MGKLTTAQSKIVTQIKRYGSFPWFKRSLKTGKEKCFIGTKKVSNSAFFFFVEIGYFEPSIHSEKRMYEYYDMRIASYKLNEFLNDFNVPYVIPE